MFTIWITKKLYGYLPCITGQIFVRLPKFYEGFCIGEEVLLIDKSGSIIFYANKNLNYNRKDFIKN